MRKGIKMKKTKFAVVGATGMVGRTFLTVLSEHNVPKENVFAVASSQSMGRDISYGEDAVLKVHSLDTFDFSTVQIALFSPGSEISKIYAPKAAAQGAVVIDNTSYFRMDPDVPLVVPEVNPDAVDTMKKGIIANPNCSTIQMLLPLKALHDLYGVKRVIVSTYQSVSGAGQAAMDELYAQTRGVLVNQIDDPVCFSKPIAFNVIPKIDQCDEMNFTKEEWKMTRETKKILSEDIDVTATCVRVPVFIGHALSMHVICGQDVHLPNVKSAFKKMKGIRLVDNLEEDIFATPIDCAGEDDVFISRLRQDPFDTKALNMWVVADNIRKGAATNAVQIAKLLLNKKKA